MAEVAVDTPVVILCGGRGTRLQERTQSIPKPLVEIGGQPIVWHVVQIFAVQGLRRFVLATGYKHDVMEESVRGLDWPEGIDVQCVRHRAGHADRRAHQAARASAWATRRSSPPTATAWPTWTSPRCYRFHRDHGGLATMTVVRPLLQFGVTELDGDGMVSGFHEKPRSDHWINGGFFCFEPGVFAYLDRSSVLEREPLEGLAADGHLRAYRHTGFWECMDTYKDAVELNDLWGEGRAPWKLWT